MQQYAQKGTPRNLGVPFITHLVREIQLRDTLLT